MDFLTYPNLDAIRHLHAPNTPFVIIHAPICRPGWLVEMECDAENT
jgi:hypothetical protein